MLTKSNIKFQTEKTFPNLKKGLLRYDFYLTERHILIEYDGPQHFQRIPKFQPNKSDFTKQKERDRAKNSFALSHSIPLYRIPYWEFNESFTISNLFNPQYLVRTKFHNDNIWREHQKSKGSNK